jgi:hypothetical protein
MLPPPRPSCVSSGGYKITRAQGKSQNFLIDAWVILARYCHS